MADHCDAAGVGSPLTKSRDRVDCISDEIIKGNHGGVETIGLAWFDTKRNLAPGAVDLDAASLVHSEDSKSSVVGEVSGDVVEGFDAEVGEIAKAVVVGEGVRKSVDSKLRDSVVFPAVVGS